MKHCKRRVPVLFFLMALSSTQCSTGDKNANTQGSRLAHQYCASCHQFPEPNLIDKLTWTKNVLPAMGARLGVEQISGMPYAGLKATISLADWKSIVAYYNNLAPAKLIIPAPKTAALKDWTIFRLKRPNPSANTPQPLTTLLAFNPYDKKLYSGDGKNNIYTWDNNLRVKQLESLPTPATDVLFYKNAPALFTCIGSLAPFNIAVGKVISYDQGKSQQVIADSLPRPVQTIGADFDKDGLTDYAVCGFGHDKGALYLLKQLKNGKFRKSLIRAVPGAIKVVTGDFNDDGWPDLMCLFAQADEGIWMFLNDKKGGFVTSNLLHFPPIYGSTNFQLVDFNHDGYPDILYTAGDNADYSPVLKPYHGVYIFINDTHYHFKQKFFYHIDGCMKAVAADFNKNGEPGIAAISFFPDNKNHASESFVYLENKSGLNFLAHELPVQQYGRWLTMDVGDFNGDGYPDVALGNFSLENNNLPDEKKLPFIVLQNTIPSKISSVNLQKIQMLRWFGTSKKGAVNSKTNTTAQHYNGNHAR